jgi:UDP-glucuronate 4-epimerase
MPVLVTGAAGFIGYHVCEALLARGEEVVGIDCLTPYYSIELKQARLAQLQARDGFRFHNVDIADPAALARALDGVFTPLVVHLAAQPGVRYSLEHPFAYAHANLTGHLAILEHCRHQPRFRHLVYGSSSSVYGNSAKLPFHEEDPVDAPVSLYAATKKGDELMSHAYASLYGLPQTGLRFFTVYGPWGRPDMAVWSFTEAIFEGRPIKVFNHGDMRRDFTYVDDIVTGVLAALAQPPANAETPHRIFNIGNNRAEPLLRLIEVLERAIGRQAETVMLPMQPGDVRETYADISAAEATLGFRPTTPIDEGLPRFVEWYRSYCGL